MVRLRPQTDSDQDFRLLLWTYVRYVAGVVGSLLHRGRVTDTIRVTESEEHTSSKHTFFGASQKDKSHKKLTSQLGKPMPDVMFCNSCLRIPTHYRV